MKLERIVGAALVVLCVCPGTVRAQFSCGSTGADGPLVVASGQSVALNVPNNGIFNYTTISVSGTLTFNRNTAFNPPVIMLATGDVVVNSGALIHVNATQGTSLAGGAGGRGGFDGGFPGIAGAEPGSGHGPGAGAPGLAAATGGLGAYGGVGSGSSPTNGPTYGSPLLFPLVGGSGGGGDQSVGGGGGGGAILLCSPTQVVINGQISALGALSALGNSSASGVGSGGAIRLLSPAVRGTGTVNVNAPNNWGGHGRIRVDLIDRSGFTLNFNPTSGLSVGSLMAVFPSVIPRLDIVHVAGNTIPQGTASPLSYTLPFNSPASQAITVKATGFTGIVPIAVVVTPDSGSRIVVNAEINADTAPAETTVNVNLPQNVTVRIHAWTR
jgi:hypothetical protein